jgi:4-amino-4-deoxy-L-arabinose transferase-like glycosyltransferase
VKKTFSPRTILIVVLVISVSLRVAAAFYLGNTAEVLPGTFDQVSYHNLAQRILAGFGLTFDTFWWPATPAGEQTAHWSYLYTFYLTVVYFIFGPNPLVARLIQAIIVGLLHPYLAYKLGTRVFNTNVGLVSAGITAVYIYFIYYSATLMTEPFYILTILASLLLVMYLAQSPQEAGRSKAGEYGLAVLLGLSLAAAILLRQLFMLVAPFLLLWTGYARWRYTRKIPLVSLLLPGAVILLTILPFTLFNIQRFDRVVLLNTNAGFAFFWGNHPIHGTNFYDILPPELPSYQQLIPRELRSLDEAALDQALLREGLQFIVDDPLRYILLSINRAKDYFVFWPSAESGLISNFTRVFSFGLFLPFMLYGLFLALFNRRWVPTLSLSTPVMLLLLYALLYTVIHLLTWTLIRYRLPVDAVLIIFAGLAFVDLTSRLSVHRQRAATGRSAPGSQPQSS